MRIIVIFVVLLALALIGATYTDTPKDGLNDAKGEPQNKSLIIFNAIKDNGIEIEDAYTTNGSEVKEAFGLEDSEIADEAEIAFVIFRYSDAEGVDIKVGSTLEIISTVFLAEPSIDGVLVMPYDPEVFALGGGTNLIYVNRSHLEGLALQNLPPRTIYNKLDFYTILQS
ncbi:hypothetical protein KKA03_04245 [archaeon]|nr:hypothetical protein [archaeon]